MNQGFMLITCLLVSVWLTACANNSNTPSNGFDSERYANAISDAAVASPKEILPLLTLPKAGRVQVVSWVTDSRIPCEGKFSCSYTTGNYVMWVTLADEVKNKCSHWKLSGDALRNRLEELLGLPHNSPAAYIKTHFVVMTVDATQLSRPCLGLLEQNGQSYCSLTADKSTSPEQQLFVLQQMASSYLINNSAGPGYPFTRLGYTYDWSVSGSKNAHYGASEFLLAENTPVNVESIQSTTEYCRADLPK